MFQFAALSSRRFQSGFDRVNLHRPTRAADPMPEQVEPIRMVVRNRVMSFRSRLNGESGPSCLDSRKLKWRAKFEISL
jgi:ribosomal protein L34